MLMGMTWFQQQLSIDLWVKGGLDHLASPFFDHFFQLITSMGSPAGLILFTVITSILLIYKRKQLEGMFLAACMLVGWGLMDGLKLFFGRPRPLGEHLTYATGYSFPSGHAMLSLIFYGFIAYLVVAQAKAEKKPAVILPAAALILLIGISRIYLNVHYASDVLGGYLFGAIILFISIKLMNWLSRRLESKGMV